jgi:hypothetical protein
MRARAQQITLFTVRSKPNQRTTVQEANVGSAAQKIEINRNDGMSDVKYHAKRDLNDSLLVLSFFMNGLYFASMLTSSFNLAKQQDELTA